MSEFVLIDSDQMLFEPKFGDALVVVQPGTLKGTATKLSVGGKPVCVVGDEQDVVVENCPYTVPPKFPAPGTGTLKNAKLAGGGETKIRDAGNSVLLRGSKFDAVFEVATPAQNPATGEVDMPNKKTYAGKGSFATTANTKLKSA